MRKPEQLSDEQAKELLDTLRRLRGYLVTHPDYQRGMLDAEMAMDQADAAIKSLPQPAQEERP